jgi:hypothetical protein
MSLSKNVSRPTTEDLSDIKELKSFPGFDSSMLGGNTITDKNPDFAGQGSDSEATHDVVAHSLSYAGYSHATPALPGPDAVTGHVGTDEKGDGYSPQHPAWKEL